ncbi:MAG: serine/threonine-protein kinase [Bradymonadia bacterium]
MSDTALFKQLEQATTLTGGITAARNSLPPDVESTMSRRLAIAALTACAIWGTLMLLPRVFGLFGIEDFVPPDRRLALDVVAGFGIFDAMGTWFLCRKGMVKGTKLIRVAVLYKIGVGAGISVIAAIPALTPEMRPTGLPPVVAWLLLFPTIVPLPMRLAAVSTVVTAATAPLVLWLFDHWGWTEPSPDIYRQMFVSITLGSVMSLIPAHVVRQLGRSVSEARAMGSYRLERLLGRGGMGEVWVARHNLLARPAAIKLIKQSAMASNHSDGTTPRVRFEREAQATASLRSPHTVEIYDYGVTEDGTFYYAMELLEGIDLDALVERFGPVPPSRAIRILRQMCDALAEAHMRGLIHRDIKPANAIITPVGLQCDLVKVLDFGLVRLRQAEAVDVGLTGEGVIAGTPAWMAPEVAMGEGVIDGRADMYAVGCVGYWLLSGRHVYTGKTPMEVILHHIQGNPPSLEEMCEDPPPPALAKILERCLAREPDDRYEDMVSLGRALAEVERSLETPWHRGAAHRWWKTHLPEQLIAVEQGIVAEAGPSASGVSATLALSQGSGHTPRPQD